MATDGGSAETPRTHFIIGSRKSELAMWQARAVKALLETAFPTFSFEIRTETSLGDRVLSSPLSSLAAANPGLFTKELEAGLISRAYDIAVHSLKDMPTTLPDGLALAGVTEREDPRDAVVLASRHASAGWRSLGDLPPGSVLGSSSLRREAYVRQRYPHLRVISVRGNLQTRLAKLDGVDATGAPLGQAPSGDAAGAAPAPAAEAVAADAAAGAASGASARSAAWAAQPGVPPSQQPPSPPTYDALLLAAAGLHRLGWTPRVSWYLPVEDGGTAVGQGALGLECRADDGAVAALLRAVSHGPTLAAVSAERAFLRRLQGGCQVPISVHTRLLEATRGGGSFGAAAPQWATLSIQGSVTALDGSGDVTAQAAGVVPVWGAQRRPDEPVPSGAGSSSSGVTGDREEVAAWDAAVEAAAEVGRALAQRVLDGGAGSILGPLTAPRPPTYGAAEVRLD